MNKSILLGTALCLSTSTAWAQSEPPIVQLPTGAAGVYGRPMTATDLQGFFGAKTDAVNGRLTNPTATGGTIAGTAITGGSVNGTPVGNATPGTGAFSTLSATGGTLAGMALTSPTIATPAVSGGTIAGTAISGGTASSTAISNGSITGTTLNGGVVTPGTSTTAQTLAAIIGRKFNILDYGAAMNCSTTPVDDTAAWQAAINAANVVGGEVEMPAGCSTVDSTTITAYSHGLKIQGQGASVSLIKAKTLTSTPFTVSGTNVHFDGLGFISASQQTSGSYIHLTTALDGYWLAHFAMTSGFIPIQIDGGVSEYISDGIFATTTPGSSTIVIAGGNDQYLSHIVSDNPAGSQPAYGILVTQNGGLWISDADFIHSGTGLAIMPGSGQSVTWGSIHDLDVDTSASDAILISPATGGTVRGMNFSDVWTSTSNRGFHITGSGVTNMVSLNHHRAFNNAQQGILVENGADFSLTASQVCGNSGGTVGLYNGVEFGVNVSHFKVQNNRIGNCAGFGNFQYANIAMDAGTGSDFLIQGNDLEGYTNHAINNAATGSNMNISGNQGDDRLPGPGLVSVTGSPFSYGSGSYNLSVNIYGGTVSNVSLGGTTIATASPVSFLMRPGQSFSVTYSAVPAIAINAAN